MARTRPILSLLLLLLTLSLPTLPAQAHPALTTITVTDDHGTIVTLAHPPQRLISLAPNVTEILFALGLGPRVVGVSTYSNYPKQALKLPVVINYSTLDQEKLLSLKPDLIVAAGIVPQATIAKLRSLHLTVLVTDPHDIKGILADIHLVANAAGVPSAGRTLDAQLQTRINAVVAKVRHATTHPRVYYELDSTLYTDGPGSFGDDLITLAGGKDIADSTKSEYPQLSKEALLVDDPQVIVLGDSLPSYGGVSPASVAARPGWSGISAVKNHRVYTFNDDLASRAGPRIVDGLEAMARLLHPELFR